MLRSCSLAGEKHCIFPWYFIFNFYHPMAILYWYLFICINLPVSVFLGLLYSRSEFWMAFFKVPPISLISQGSIVFLLIPTSTGSALTRISHSRSFHPWQMSRFQTCLNYKSETNARLWITPITKTALKRLKKKDTGVIFEWNAWQLKVKSLQ